MLLKDKVAAIYGGGGAIGGAIARTFAREGATLYLAGRSPEKLAAVARDIAMEGGKAHVAVVDAFDEVSVTAHVEALVGEAGGLDVVVNAVGHTHVQGKPLEELALAEFEEPIRAYARSHFVIAKAATRPMVARRAGVFLVLSTPGACIGFPGVLGFGSACGAIESFSRHLARELGPSGVRVVCLRPDAIPETLAHGSHAREVFQTVADRAGLSLEALLDPATSTSPLQRYPRLEEVASAAAFVASARGGAMTGTVMNLTCGSAVD